MARHPLVVEVTRLNLGSGHEHVLDGFANLDKETGWLFEDGLAYPDGSVEAITVSHALYRVALADWPFVFGEFARVLEPGGIVRVTEDSATDPRSSRYGGFHDAVTLTSPGLVLSYMTSAGLEARRVKQNETFFKDTSLIQNWHGPPPKTFAVEGIKP